VPILPVPFCSAAVATAGAVRSVSPFWVRNFRHRIVAVPGRRSYRLQWPSVLRFVAGLSFWRAVRIADIVIIGVLANRSVTHGLIGLVARHCYDKRATNYAWFRELPGVSLAILHAYSSTDCAGEPPDSFDKLLDIL
jgi:hypothetical protein